MSEKLKMRFKAHQSFFIRKGWLGKGLKAVRQDRALLMPSNSKLAMDELGLGANQVVALRYWLEVTGLVKKLGKDHETTMIGDLVLENDPYIEELGTLWALHCNLASSKADAAAWYFFFNEFRVNVFDKEDFTRAIEHFIFTYNNKPKIALNSLDSDFTCILNTYAPHTSTSARRLSPENVIESPFVELGLIDVENREMKSYRKSSANASMLPSLLVLYAICSMRSRSTEVGEDVGAEIKLDTLLDGPYGPGRLFNLDSVGLLSKLYELQNDGYLRVTRTAGLDVVRLNDAQMREVDCLTRYYEMIG